MNQTTESWQATFEETRARQIRLGLEITPRERLRWLDSRRAEILRLREGRSTVKRDEAPSAR